MMHNLEYLAINLHNFKLQKIFYQKNCIEGKDDIPVDLGFADNFILLRI